MADNTFNRIAGICYLSIDGTRYALKGEFAYQVSGVHREAIIGQDGPHGRKEKPVMGFVSGKISDMGGLSLVTLGGLVDVTVIAELANGKTAVARNAFWSGDPPKADAEEAEIEFKFESRDVTDQPAI
jgi:hypothetical protein